MGKTFARRFAHLSDACVVCVQNVCVSVVRLCSRDVAVFEKTVVVEVAKLRAIFKKDVAVVMHLQCALAHS